MRFYFEQFSKYKEKFLAARREGNLEEARYALLRAAEFLFKMAA